MDYEAAGFHPIMLDLARTFHNNLYFDILFMDLLPKGPETMSVIEEEPHERWNYGLH